MAGDELENAVIGPYLVKGRRTLPPSEQLAWCKSGYPVIKHDYNGQYLLSAGAGRTVATQRQVLEFIIAKRVRDHRLSACRKAALTIYSISPGTIMESPLQQRS
jgi:hypothetical protein